MQNIDDKRCHERVGLVIVATLKNKCDHRKDSAKCEKYYQERIDVLGHLGEHFYQEAKVLIVPDQLQEFDATLNETNNADNLQPKSLGAIANVQLLAFKIDLKDIENELRTIHVVPSVLEI